MLASLLLIMLNNFMSFLSQQYRTDFRLSLKTLELTVQSRTERLS